jgi:hypothetical protein
MPRRPARTTTSKDALFGVPTQAIALALLAGVGLLALWFAWMGWRATLLFRLGARNVPRRPARAALIAFGLILSTTVVGSAFGAGDAMTWTVRSVVTESLGTVDEVVLLNPSRPSRSDRVKALTEPGLATIAGANPTYFAQADADRLAANVAGADALPAVVPVILDQVAVIDPATQLAQASTLLLALPPAGASQLGAGAERFSNLGPDDVLLNEAAAVALGTNVDGELHLLRDETATPSLEDAWQVRVAGVLSDGGVAGQQPIIRVALAR